MTVPNLPYSEPVRLHQVPGGVKRTLEPDAAARARIARSSTWPRSSPSPPK